MLNVYNILKKKSSNLRFNIWDIISIATVFVLFMLLAKAATGMGTPYKIGEPLPISLDISSLPYYSIRTVFRMAIALVISLLFSLIIGYASAKNRRAEMVFIPLIDILQSVPVQGFLSLSVIPFIMLFPNTLLGPECAAIFAIFSSQAWNMTLSIYQSVKILPKDYHEVGLDLNLNAWQRFWRIELPYATPGLLWNMMVSLSSGWFYVVASEAISVNKHEILLPGIGSYIAIANDLGNTTAMIYAIVAMLIIIFVYDQLIFRPLLKVSTQFQDIHNSEDIDLNHNHNNNKNKPYEYNSWVYDVLQKTHLVKELLILKDYLVDFWINYLALAYKKIKAFISDVNFSFNFIYKLNFKNQPSATKNRNKDNNYYSNTITIDWFACLILLLLITGLAFLFDFIHDNLSYHEIFHVIYLGFITWFKIFILVMLCSLFWIPIGVYVGSNPSLSKYMQPVIQFLAAFPANIFYPFFALFIIKYNLNVELATAPLLIIGTQWYILFNVIAGINAIPKDIKDAVKNLQVKRLLWWRKVMLPAIFPYYITGAITAVGGAWNASLLAEALQWNKIVITATGLGSYIAQAATNGDFARQALGITVMTLYVIILNKTLWQRLYNLSANRYQMLS
jgi:NitT/TauT family transport system permease protein